MPDKNDPDVSILLHDLTGILIAMRNCALEMGNQMPEYVAPVAMKNCLQIADMAEDYRKRVYEALHGEVPDSKYADMRERAERVVNETLRRA